MPVIGHPEVYQLSFRGLSFGVNPRKREADHKLLPYRAELYYIYHNPASRSRRQEGNPVPVGYTCTTLFLRDISMGLGPEGWANVVSETDPPPSEWRMTVLKNGVFWDITPCGSCKNRRFGGT
jgi:hypothetical protein